jgi:hypothetical protein
MLGEAVDVGQVVDQAAGGENPSRDDRVAADELDAEGAVLASGHARRAAVENLYAVAADLLAADSDQLGRRRPLMAQVAMHVRGRCVSRLAGVDDDDRSTLAAKLERGAEPGC